MNFFLTGAAVGAKAGHQMDWTVNNALKSFRGTKNSIYHAFYDFVIKENK